MSDPMVFYCESVSQLSSVTRLGKLLYRHNCIDLTAESLVDQLSNDIEVGKRGPKSDPNERVKNLREKYEWDENTAKEIWCYGPKTDGVNVVVDTTQAVQYQLEIKERVYTAFQWASKEDPVCKDNMRGCRSYCTDVSMRPDAIHLDVGQIMSHSRC